jgi:hypothetical protein
VDAPKTRATLARAAAGKAAEKSGGQIPNAARKRRDGEEATRHPSRYRAAATTNQGAAVAAAISA